MDERTDAELIGSARDGDDAAFRELMMRYMAPVLNFSRQYAKSAEDADDIVQDSFFKAWRNLRRFDERKPFKPWLYAIARNTALDHLKRRRATAFSELDDDESDLRFADTLEDDEPTATELFEQAELAAVVAAAMEDLHPDHRAVLIMRYRDEMAFDEIAGIMKRPMNTVKSWHHRALGRLKKSLGGSDPLGGRRTNGDGGVV